jgi:hypothetical protein
MLSEKVSIGNQLVVVELGSRMGSGFQDDSNLNH